MVIIGLVHHQNVVIHRVNVLIRYGGGGGGGGGGGEILIISIYLL